MNGFKIRGLALVAATALATLAATHASAAPLVTNGDFDNLGNVWVNNTGLGSDDLLTPGSTDIPDWTNVAGFANEFWVGSGNSYGLTASPGNGSAYFVDLTGQSNSKPYGGIEQTIATTAGQKYTLSFDLGSSTQYNGSGTSAAALTASATGTTSLASSLFTLVPNSSNEWMTETLTFTADSSSTVIEFLADSSYTSEYTGLDNVSVAPAAVPEPATWALMLVGFGGLGAAMRSRRRQVPATA